MPQTEGESFRILKESDIWYLYIWKLPLVTFDDENEYRWGKLSIEWFLFHRSIESFTLLRSFLLQNLPPSLGWMMFESFVSIDNLCMTHKFISMTKESSMIAVHPHHSHSLLFYLWSFTSKRTITPALLVLQNLFNLFV